MDNLTPQPPPVVEPSPLSKSGSVWKVIVLIVVLLGLSAAGYFAYQKFFGGSSGVALSLPPGLEKYAVGEDAQALILVRNDSEIIDILENFDVPIDVESFKNAIFLAKKEGRDEVMAAALQFDSEESAASVKEWLVSQPNLFDADIVIDGNIIIMSSGGGFDGLSGSLYDNPLIENIGADHVDDQIVMVFDAIAIPDFNINSLILNALLAAPPLAQNVVEDKSFFPVAHAAGLLQAGDNPILLHSEPDDRTEALQAMSLLRYSKSNGLFINLESGKLIIALVSELVAEDEIAEFFEDLGAGMGETLDASDDELEEIKEFYEEGLSSLEDSIPKIEDLFKNIPSVPPGAEMDVELKELTFSIIFEVPVLALVGLYQKQMEGSASNAKDAQRAVILRKTQAALIVGLLESGFLPEESMCIEDLSVVDADMLNTLHEETAFGDLSCNIGYYQRIPGKGILLWAKVDNVKNGNTELTPETIVSDDIDKYSFSNFEGEYYAIFVENDDTEEEEVEENKKVER
ncbi:MAG: hypothetical protein O3B47_02175 [bacterium]|nr:hypothetical protein [bacterium]